MTETPDVPRRDEGRVAARTLDRAVVLAAVIALGTGEAVWRHR